MVQEHYFSSNPDIEAKENRVSFQVADQLFDLTASSGTFSSRQLDPGTRVLLNQHENFPIGGDVLDLGCGWGPIGISIAKLSPNTKVTGVDVNNRSIELANQNAAKLGLTNFRAIAAEHLPDEQRFDAIWSNPPIRIGKEKLHELLSKNISLLRDSGSAYLVVQKQLGADSLQRWLADEFPNRSVERIQTDKGYRVIFIGPSSAQ